jgi:UDP-glucose-4-epimerase GalE
MNNKTIFITGGAGYIGKPTASRLSQLGYQVIVYDKTPHVVLPSSIIFIEGDILDKPRLFAAMKSVKPDIVIHLAALISVSDSEKNHALYTAVNVQGIKNILSAMQEVGCKKILFSSSAAVYKDSINPVSEENTIQPTSYYGKTKELGEHEIQKEKTIQSVILRYFNIVGSTSDGLFGETLEHNPKLIPSAIRVGLGMDKKLRIYGRSYKTSDGTAIRDYVSLEDVVNVNVQAVRYLISHRSSLVCNIGSGRGSTNLEVVHMVEDVMKKKIPLEIQTPRVETVVSIANIERAKKELGWEPRFSRIQNIIEQSLPN